MNNCNVLSQQTKLFGISTITVDGDSEQLSRYSTKFQGLVRVSAPPRAVWKENKPAAAANQASYGAEPGATLRAFLIQYEGLPHTQRLHVKARRRDCIFRESSSNAQIKPDKGLKLPF